MRWNSDSKYNVKSFHGNFLDQLVSSASENIGQDTAWEEPQRNGLTVPD
jgi:hypothetical protein